MLCLMLLPLLPGFALVAEEAAVLAEDEAGDVAASALEVEETPEEEAPLGAWLEAVTHPDVEQQEAAWSEAAGFGPQSVAPLVEILLEGNAAEAQAARIALDDLAHRHADPAAVARALLDALPQAVEAGAPVEDVAVEPGQGLFPLLEGVHARIEAAQSAHTTQAQAGHVAQVRRDVLHWLGLVAGAGETARIAALLPDAEVRQAALAALIRIPGEAPAEALAAALGGAPRDLQLALIEALGARPSPVAEESLKLAVLAGAPEVQWAGLVALSRMGVPPDAVLPHQPDWRFEESARYASAALRAAQVLAERGERQRAQRIFFGFMDMHALRFQMRAALLGLAALEAPEVVRFALGNLGSPPLRETAISVLAEVEVPGVEDQLSSAYQAAAADPAMRAALLQVLARRGSGRLHPLLNQALGSGEAELAFVAAQLAGEPPHEQHLAKLVLEGNPWVRPQALRAFLDLAHSRAIRGEFEDAAEQFRAIADGPFPEVYRREALESLGHIGREEDREVIVDYLHNPRLNKAAYAALVNIAARQEDAEAAKEELTEIARSAASESGRASAVQALRELGADTRDFPLRQGFVTNWRVLGPFPNHDGDALEKAFFNEARADAEELVEFEGVPFQWKDVSAAGIPAVLDLHEVFGPYENVAGYGTARVAVPGWTPIELRVGSAGPYRIWLNGSLVHTREGSRAFTPDADLLSANLRPGVNRILVKVLHEDGPWQFALRVTDRNGIPLDLSKQRLPDDGMTGVGVLSGDALSGAGALLP